MLCLQRRMRPALLAVPLALFLCPLAVADSPSAPDQPPLDLLTAARQALAAHPDLAFSLRSRRAADGLRLQAGLRPNPELGIEIDNVAGTGAYRGVDAVEATLRLGWILERTDKRDARIGTAELHRAEVDADFELARLDVLADTTRRFIDTAEGQERRVLAQQALSTAEDTLVAAERRVQAGAASSLEINRARIAVERARLDIEHETHALLSHRRRLAAQWDGDGSRVGPVQAQLLVLQPPPEHAALLARLRRSPDFTRYDLTRRMRDAELQQVRSQARGDLSLSGGVRRLQADRDVALVAALLIPLPVRDRNQGAIAAATALRDRVDSERRAALLRSEVALFDLYQELLHAHSEVASLTSLLIPQAEEALMLTRRGYANGRYTQIDLLDAQRSLLELQRERIAAAAGYHRTLAAIERMTALTAPDSTTSPTP